MKLIELYKLKLSVGKIKIDVILEYVNITYFIFHFGAVDESMRSIAIKRVTATTVVKLFSEVVTEFEAHRVQEGSQIQFTSSTKHSYFSVRTSLRTRTSRHYLHIR